MDEVDRYIPARNARGPGEGIAPKHATKWAQYSPEWYDSCQKAFVKRMKDILGLEPEDPRERTQRIDREAVARGDLFA